MTFLRCVCVSCLSSRSFARKLPCTLSSALSFHAHEAAYNPTFQNFQNPTIFVFLRRQILAVAVEGKFTVDNVLNVGRLLIDIQANKSLNHLPQRTVLNVNFFLRTLVVLVTKWPPIWELKTPDGLWITQSRGCRRMETWQQRMSRHWETWYQRCSMHTGKAWISSGAKQSPGSELKRGRKQSPDQKNWSTEACALWKGGQAWAQTRESLNWIHMTRTARQDARRSGKEDAGHSFVFGRMHLRILWGTQW